MSSERDAGEPRRLIVGISGASGIIYGIHALKVLRRLGVSTSRHHTIRAADAGL